MDTTEIVSFYQNSPYELYLLFEQFCDHFHATSRNSMYMNFISSHSNNIHALEQLRSIKDKASSSAQADKAIAEIEAKCGQKIEECKEEQRQQLMRIEDEHTLLISIEKIKALRCELEDECQKLEEELHLQKSKEDRQRALLQLQLKVMSDKPKEDQEVNSK
ncbi:hypothetical protein JHK85_016522 [Glycine max]|nr:hypothetical protein JHK85_016522 [Glycine max]